MKNLLLKLERFVPFLSLPRLSAPAGRGGGRLRRVSVDRLHPGVVLSDVEFRKHAVEDCSLKHAQFYRAAFRELSFDAVDLSESAFSHCTLQDCRVVSSSFAGTRWRVVAADRIAWSDCALKQSSWVGVSFREASFENCDLSRAEVVMSDGFAARFRAVRAPGIVLRAVDLSYASLEDVDLTDADLRGCRFARGRWDRVVLDGALVDGADLRGVRGLTRELRLDLMQRGATMWRGWTERVVWHLLSRFRPGWAPERIDRQATRALFVVRLLSVLGLLAALIAGARAGCAGPPPHESGVDSGWESAWRKRTATEEEIRRTRENLKRLRQAIANAYATTARYGIARYPTGAEVAGNRFDKDGDGPGTETVELVPGGLPKNFLTDGEGVAPYCNDVPTQETLSGDNTDWHYCDATGRVFACGGYTDLPTLDW